MSYCPIAAKTKFKTNFKNLARVLAGVWTPLMMTHFAFMYENFPSSNQASTVRSDCDVDMCRKFSRCSGRDLNPLMDIWT